MNNRRVTISKQMQGLQQELKGTKEDKLYKV